MHAALSCAGRRLLAAGLALLAAAGPALAQSADEVAELKRQLARSLQLIEALNARVSQLERQLAPAPGAASAPSAPSPVPDAATEARLAQVERAVDQLSAGADGNGIALHGFADAQAVGLRHARPGQHGGFAIGSLDFYLTPELGERVKTLVELNFGVDEEGETEADLERLQIGYTFSDALTLWLGRFHSPFGYWNMAYHHGAQIQTGILRPRMLDFEDDDGFLPVHTVGLWATGARRFGSDRVLYHLYAGNGAHIEDGQLHPNPNGDDSGNKVAGFGLNVRLGGAMGGWTVGINGLTQKVNAYAGGALTGRTRLQVLGAHAVYEDNGWEAMAEGYAIRNTDLLGGSGAHRSWSAYVQLGHSFDERWMPYARLEKATLDAADPYFLALNSGRFSGRQVLGLRYNADARVALKLEWNRTRERGLGTPPDELRLQYAIGF